MVTNAIGKPATLILDGEQTAPFKKLQESLVHQFTHAFPDRLAPKTIVVVPSLTLDPEILEKLTGQIYYEERMLCLLMLLRMPNTHVVYITSIPIDPVIIDYYLHLLPGVTGYHAQRRLTMLSCYDSSAISLTEKILRRKRLVARIKKTIPADHAAHLVCFNVTPLEKKLALTLGIPIYGCDPDLWWLGTKSGARQVFRTVEVAMPKGKENLRTKEDIADTLFDLKVEDPQLQKAVIKLNDGFSGDGNAIFSYQDLPLDHHLKQSIIDSFEPRLRVVAHNLNQRLFVQKFEEQGGTIEEFIDGKIKASPSVQCRINPLNQVDIISTHDQLLSGEYEQVFAGGTFPANGEYASQIADISTKISQELASYGVLGRFSIDFLSVKQKDEWKHYALEINLRKGGTTHPYLMLQFLTDGHYDAKSGKFFTATGQQRFYFATDNVVSDSFKGLTPADLMDIAMLHDLLYDGTTQEGVMFHMISALSQYGKLGVVCIGRSPEIAKQYFSKTLETLEFETSAFSNFY
ncbi:MAG TPA: peptide ligase PGM1-related protein [Chitinophagaceae bacterium]|nr:peptide ligase PGM1-related protein [Chitinophagaceae bacterium]